MRLTVDDITPVTKIKNEDYWIYYVLREPLRRFKRFIILDTGSTDKTKEIVRTAPSVFDGEIRLIEEDYGDDPDLIGNSMNILRKECTTEWMMLIDGDEIWSTDQLDKLLELDVPDHVLTVMVGAHNLTFYDDQVMRREYWNADRLFRPSVKWTRTNYPYEDHGLHLKAQQEQLIYTPAFFWHVRHLVRSSKDDEAYCRDFKRKFFPWSGPYHEMPSDWIGELGPYPNPYLGVS